MGTLVIGALATAFAAGVFLGLWVCAVVRRFFPLAPFAERVEETEDKH